MPEKQSIKLFVYGTLMQGYRNHPLLEGATFLSTADLFGSRMYNVGSFPCIDAPMECDDEVHGELYEISEDMLPRLDRLEGVPTMYRREEHTVWIDGTIPRQHDKAFVYVWAGEVDHLPVIESGRWE